MIYLIMPENPGNGNDQRLTTTEMFRRLTLEGGREVLLFVLEM